MAAETTGTALTYALGGTAAPGAQSIAVPADALAVAFFSSWYAAAGTTLTITTNFTQNLGGTPNVINSALAAATDEYIFRGWAKVTGTGSKTFTPTWNNAQSEGPLLFVVFVKGIDPDVAPLDWDGLQIRNTTTYPAITLDTAADSLVLLMNRQYNSGGAIPGLIAGTTSLATLPNRSQAGRLASVNAPGATSTTLTSTVNNYAGIAAIVFAPGSGADTVSPIMSGAIAATRISDTSYSVTGWGASDNVAVVGYEIRVNAGAWTNIGTNTSHTFTGRTYQATDTVEVRAYDAVPNYATPLTKDVIVGAVMVPITALDGPGNLESNSNVQLQWRSVDGAMPPHKTSLVIAWEWFDQVPGGTEFYARWWDLPNDTHSTMPAGNRFVGYHPYPSTPNTNHVFEIAGLPSNDVVTLEGGGQMAVTKGQWYATAHYKELVAGGATVRHVYYPDLINSSARIVVDVATSVVDAATISNPVLRLGGGNWTESGGGSLNSEAINGLVRGIRMFDISAGTPTYAQIKAEAEAAQVGGATTLSGVWYRNDNPTPSDVLDKSGNGHHPAFRGSAVPGLWSGEVATYPSATPTISPEASSSGATVADVTVSQTHQIAPDASSAGATVLEAAVTQTHQIAPESSSAGATVAGVSFAQTHQIAVEASQSGATVADVSIGSTVAVTPESSQSGATAAPVGFVQGFLGSTILSATGIGDNGPGILYNDMRVGDDANRYYFVITRAPTNGTLDIDPIGTFTYTGTADSFDYELFENNVSLGGATVSLAFAGAPIDPEASNAGATVAAVSFSQTPQIAVEASQAGATVAGVPLGDIVSITPEASQAGATVQAVVVVQTHQIAVETSQAGTTSNTVEVVMSDPPDLTAPVLSSPTGAAAGATAAAGTATTDEGNGTLYWVTTANGTELLATIKAGRSQTVTAVGTQTVYTPGLAPETVYYNHYAHTDAAGNDSNVVSSAQFTTSAVPAGSSVGAKGMHISTSISL